MFKVNDKRVKIRHLEEDIDKINIQYVNDLDAIKVSILNTSNLENMEKYIPELVMATWNEDIEEFNKSLTKEDREKFVFRTIQGKFIPTALDSINITFKIEGITWHDVSHLIRHQNFKFAADCSGDKVMENRPIALPEFIDDIMERNEYDKAMKILTKIYNKAINHGVHIQDARLMLPRTMTTFYYVTGSLNTCISFIKQRIDRQVQPKSDNIMAYQLLLELCKVIPQLTCIVNPDMKNMFYINETKTNFASKWQKPLPQNTDDINSQDLETSKFVYGNMSRDDLPGNRHFVELLNKYHLEFENMRVKYYESHKELVDSCTKGEWK